MGQTTTITEPSFRTTIPARLDIWINGSYWAGSILGTLVTFLLLNGMSAGTGWRSGSSSARRLAW